MLTLARRLLVGTALLLSALPQAEANIGASTKANSDAVAVIIGNSHYQHGDIPPVSYAHRDAEAMATFARDVLGLRDENIIILKDASQAQMESALGRPGNPRGKAFQYIRPGESDLLVFYSGHGVPGPNDGKRYLLPADADLATVDINGYPLSALYDNLTHTDARSVTVFLDACFSGTSPGGTLLPNASGITIVPEDTAEPTFPPVPLTVVTAASADQLASWDQTNQHGLFTEYLLQGLYGKADAAPYGTKDGKVTLKEIDAYLNREMRYRARRDYNREQVPYISGNPNTVLAMAKDGAFPERETFGTSTKVIEPEPTPTPETIKVTLSPLDEQVTATTNVNVREGPGTEFDKVALLRSGAKVRAIGEVIEKPWLLIEHEGKRLGYVHENLVAFPGELETTEVVVTEDSREVPVDDSPEVIITDERIGNQVDSIDTPFGRISTKQVIEELFKIITPGQQPSTDPDIYRRAPPRKPDVRPERYPPQRHPNDLRRPPKRSELPPAELKLIKNMRRMTQLLLDQNRSLAIPVHVACPNRGSQIQCRKIAVSSLSYSHVVPRPKQCALDARVNLHHDKLTNRDGSQKRIDLRNKQLHQSLRRTATSKVRALNVRSQLDGVVKTVRYYKYGDMYFTNKADRNSFARLAADTADLCRSRPSSYSRR